MLMIYISMITTRKTLLENRNIMITSVFDTLVKCAPSCAPESPVSNVLFLYCSEDI